MKNSSEMGYVTGFDDRSDEVEEFLVENLMIQIIVHAFIENSETGVVEVLFASENSQVISEKKARATKSISR